MKTSIKQIAFNTFIKDNEMSLKKITDTHVYVISPAEPSLSYGWKGRLLILVKYCYGSDMKLKLAYRK